MDISPFSRDAYDGDAKVIAEDTQNTLSDISNRMIEREVFDRGSDVDQFTKAVQAGRRHSIITGIGPYGSMHIGHLALLYFARHLQENTGAQVYIPISDDEKLFTRTNSVYTIQDYTRQAIENVLAVGFDPNKTTLILDLQDSDMIYPLASRIATEIPPSQIGSMSDNIGQMFYPAVQSGQILLPQLIYGNHPTLVISGYDQESMTRVTRDIADKLQVKIAKPGYLLSHYMPSVTDDSEKMSSSADQTDIISVNDSRRDIEEKIMSYGQTGTEITDNIGYQLLYYFFEENTEEMKNIYEQYETGKINDIDVKRIATQRISEFVLAHNARRESTGSTTDTLNQYRLTMTEKRSALTRVGYSAKLFFDDSNH